MPVYPGAFVAVGTALTGGPPHRSQRAGLPHWAPTSGVGVEAHAGPGMRDPDTGQPPKNETVHPRPGQAGALAATPKRPTPVPDHLIPKRFRRRAIAGHGIVGEVPPHHACQPSALRGDGQVPACHQLRLYRSELRPQPLRDRETPQPEAPGPGLPADMRETQEIERLRLTQTPRRPLSDGVPPELDQPGLVRVQRQTRTSPTAGEDRQGIAARRPHARNPR